MKKKLIVHIVQAAGGVDVYLRMLLKYFNKECYRHILICSKEYNTQIYETLCEKIEVIDMPRSINYLLIKTVLDVRKIIKRYNPDIVYAHSSFAGVIARVADLGLKNICVYNPHGWAFNMKTTKLKTDCYIVIERILSKFCDAIICISDAEKQSALDCRICSPNKIHVIYNGVDIEEHCVKEQNIGDEDQNSRFVVGMVGRLATQKAPDVFVRMARKVKDRIPEAQFVIVGDGELKNDIEKEIEDNNLSKDFMITGWVNDPISYIRKFDVAVLLSRWEGFGLAIAEYMMCQKPVVATNVDAIPNIIIDGENGLLVPMDDEGCACDKVVELYNNIDLRRKIAIQGRKDVEKKFDAKRVSLEHVNLFDEMTVETECNGGLK